jgi:plastocyanin
MRRWALLALAVAAVAVPVGRADTGDAPERTVTMPGKAYDPSHLDVLVGTTVTWKNGDSINHTVTADGDAFASGYMPPGGSFSFTFAKQGRYAFHCTIHKFMRGEVDVFGLVLTGPEGPVSAGRRVVFAGLAPAGTERVTLHAGDSERTGRPHPDGSFAIAATVDEPGRYRASAGSLVSPAVRVPVRPLVRASAAGGTIRVRVMPARPGARFVLQSYDREHFAWRRVGHGTLDKASRATLRLPDGVDRARVLLVADDGWADAASRPIVRRPAR